MGTPAPATRALAAWVVVGWAVAAGSVLATSADAQPAPARTAERERGGELYQRWCAVCHATDGTGTAAGPPIDGVSIALMDLTMRTGAMPLTDPNRGVRERTFTDAEREAALAYMVARFGLDGEISEPGPGDVVRGQDLYTVHCAACHGASGQGGVAGGEATVPRTRGLEPMLIAQAVRVGPFQMPAFSREQLDDEGLNDIIVFLADPPSNSPLGLADLDRVTAFVWALLLGGVVLATCWWIAHHPVRAPDADLPRERQPKGSGS